MALRSIHCSIFDIKEIEKTMQKLLATLTLLFAAHVAVADSAPPSMTINVATLSDIRQHAGVANVTGHRGSSGSAPENTLSAILKAIEEGAGYAEIDVQETADGVLVLMHDSNPRRTTGIDKPLWEITYDSLIQASAGSWYNARFEQEKVPTLEEALVLAAKGNLKLNIELKNYGHQKQLAEKTVQLIEKHDFVERCIVTSFDKSLLGKVKKLNKQIKTGLIIDSPPTEEVFKSGDYEAISAAHNLIYQDFMAKAAKYGKEVYAWIVNDKYTAQRLLKLGVKNFISDYPKQMIAWVSEHTQP